MKIGADFDKIAVDIWGLHLLEPNTALGDLVILMVALLFYSGLNKKNDFYNLWAKFYLCFGFSFLLGGLGHLLFHYFGLFGKSFSWLLGIVSPYFIEKAMLSLWHNPRQRKQWLRLSMIKTIVFVILEIAFLLTMDLHIDPSRGLIIPTLSSILGLGFCLVILAWKYQKSLHTGFRYFWIGSLVLIPNAGIQALKINLHPWFDRNDLSHVLLLFGLIIYYVGLKKLTKFLSDLQMRQLT